jgi:hypothetical protein
MSNKDFNMRQYIDIINESNELDMLMEEIINEIGFTAAKNLIKQFNKYNGKTYIDHETPGIPTADFTGKFTAVANKEGIDLGDKKMQDLIWRLQRQKDDKIDLDNLGVELSDPYAKAAIAHDNTMAKRLIKQKRFDEEPGYD